jgi:hypothetical protein
MFLNSVILQSFFRDQAMCRHLTLVPGAKGRIGARSFSKSFKFLVSNFKFEMQWEYFECGEIAISPNMRLLVKIKMTAT